MESNRVPNNQMAIRGVVLVLALIAAGAFVLARGLDDDSDTTVVESTPTPTVPADPTVEPSEPSGGDNGTAPEADEPSEPSGGDNGTAPEPTDAPDPTQEPTPEPEELICRSPDTVGVLVANGTNIGGRAGQISTLLNTRNYVTLPPVNADAQTASAIYYRAGFGDDAGCIANILAVSVPTYPMSDPPPGGVTLGNASVLVLIGPDSLAQPG